MMMRGGVDVCVLLRWPFGHPSGARQKGTFNLPLSFGCVPVKAESDIFGSATIVGPGLRNVSRIGYQVRDQTLTCMRTSVRPSSSPTGRARPVPHFDAHVAKAVHVSCE